MATIERRKSRGKTVYYAKVRIKGQAQSATFHSLSEARQWVQKVEVGILEGQVSPAKHTVEAEYAKILQCVQQRNPLHVEAGRATSPDALKQRIRASYTRRHAC